VSNGTRIRWLTITFALVVGAFLVGKRTGSPTDGGTSYSTPTTVSRPSIVPVPSPTETEIPTGLLGGIVFGTDVYISNAGFYMPNQQSTFTFPSSVAWTAFFRDPVGSRIVRMEIERLTRQPIVVYRQQFFLSRMTVREMTFVISPDEWRRYGLSHKGLYLVRYVAGDNALALGSFQLR
jgi:hypothetical protein